jgi:hypothetical protein
MLMVKSAPVSRTDRQIAWLLLALAGALYLRTLVPGLLDGDSGEFQTAAWRFGLAHATGYPLYLLAGGLWQHLLALLGVTPAAALNAFSAVTAASAVALLYLSLVEWLPGSVVARRLGALFAALLLASNPTFWSQALIAEVYALHTLLLVAILWSFGRFVAIHRPKTDEPNEQARLVATESRRALLALAGLVGLALTHHGLTLLLLPPLLVALTLVDKSWWRSWRTLVGMALAVAAPLLLYLYIPLRSGPAASPWYHQSLGAGTLSLYEPGWRGFVDFVTGRSIAVGFYTVDRALANLNQAWLLWRIHFTWVGLLLMAGGLVALWRQQNWPVLVLTVAYLLIQQLFNLFYAIGDILVYYIPLYLTGAIWCGFAVNALATMAGPANQATDERSAGRPALSVGLVVALACFLLPLSNLRNSYPQLDQSTATASAEQWQKLLAAQPPGDAILVSNDRNEIVPLFYLQAVEGQAEGMVGLFPLIKPGDAFKDIGATVESALRLGRGRPVYLIKPMPGLEVKFALKPAADPLVRVIGQAAAGQPAVPVDVRFGPLQLVGYDWEQTGDSALVALYWRVITAPANDYTTTVQLFDAQNEKLAQDDRSPGGVYYPTSAWKPGETLREVHPLALAAQSRPASLLVGMYAGPDLTPLAAPLVIDLQAK